MATEPAILCTICARGGSKGVPDKNIRTVGEKPLVAHSIDHARRWDRCTDHVVSTDSDEIAAVAREHGGRVPFERPAELATDDAAKPPVIQHALAFMEDERGRDYDYVVDLGVAAPLRTVGDVEDCFLTVHESDADRAYTVYEADRNPYFNMVELDDDGYASLSKTPDDDVVTRQSAPTVYAMNASIYAYERDFLASAESVRDGRAKVSVMPRERSFDVDEPLDLELVEYLMERR